VYFKKRGLNKRVVYICAGSNFAGAIDETGSLYVQYFDKSEMWGNNEFGQLAQSPLDMREAFFPTLVPLDSRCLFVSCGLYHTGVILSRFRLFAWGSNVHGQLGIGGFDNCHSPAEIEDLRAECCNYICCGIDNTMASNEVGKVFGWGNNAYYKMGIEKNLFRPEQIPVGRNQPRPVQYNLSFEKSNEFLVMLKLEKAFTIGVTNLDKIYCWGWDFSREDDVPNFVNDRVERVYGIQLIHSEEKGGEKDILADLGIDRNIKFEKVCCGQDFTLALTTFGELIVWGSNLEGQHGTEPEEISKAYKEMFKTGSIKKRDKMFTIECFPHFIPYFSVSQNKRITNFCCGQKHVIAIENEKTAYSWGDNSYGQLGLGRGILQSKRPERIVELSGLELVDCVAALEYSIIRTNTGDLWSFGHNKDGKLGLGIADTSIVVYTPKKIEKINSVIQVSAGASHVLAVTQVRAEETTIFDQLCIDVNIEQKKSPKKSGNDKEKILYAWGNGLMGQLGHRKLESANSPVKINLKGDLRLISAGYEHSAAIVDKSMYIWGSALYFPKDWTLTMNELCVLRVDKNALIIEPFEVRVKNKKTNTLFEFEAIVLGKNYNLIIEKGYNEVYKWDGKSQTNIASQVNKGLEDVLVGGSVFSASTVSQNLLHSAAISMDRSSIFCWGTDNYTGRLGNMIKIVQSLKKKEARRKEREATHQGERMFKPTAVTVEPEEVEIIGHLFSQRVNDLQNKKSNKNILESQGEGTKSENFSKSMVGGGESTVEQSTNDVSTTANDMKNKSKFKMSAFLDDEYLDFLEYHTEKTYLELIELLKE
jgi:alpha-tubulin suppressor-like RCC1 family protein